MKRTSSNPATVQSPHAIRSAHKYGAAINPKTVQEAERSARDFHTFLSDSRRNGKPIYLKPSAQGKQQPDKGEQAPVEGQEQVPAKDRCNFFSTSTFSRNESTLGWFTQSLLKQSGSAQKNIESMASRLTQHPDEDVQAAATEVLKEVRTGRATSYGGLASSGNLRLQMSLLIGALDDAKGLADAGSAPQREPQPTAQSETPVAQNTLGEQAGNTSHRTNCCVLREAGGGFSQTYPKEIAALTVYHVLKSPRTPSNGVMFLERSADGLDLVGVRPKDDAITAEAAQAERVAFARFLEDLCKAYRDDPRPQVHRAAKRGLKLAQLGLEKDLPNAKGMVQLFEVLTQAEPRETTAQAPVKHPRGRVPMRPQGRPAPFLKVKDAAPRSPERPIVARVDADDPRNVHTNFSTPAAILKSLLNLPKHYVLRTTVDSSGAVHIEAVPPSENPVTGAHDPADKKTCVLLANVARDYLTNTDPNVRAMAEKLQTLARESNNQRRAIRNGPGLHEMLAALTPQPQPKAPTITPVAQTAPAYKGGPAPTRWVVAGSYTSESPRKLRPQPAALTQLVNSLLQAPTNWRLEVGTDVTGDQVSVRARPPGSPQEPFDKVTNEATYRFFQDLADHYIEKYRNSKKESDKAFMLAAVRLRKIASAAEREQINTPITNGEKLQGLLLQLAAAG